MSNKLKTSLLFAGFLSLAAVGSLFINTQRVVAYQLTSSGAITDASRNRVLIRVLNSDAVAHEVGDVLVWKDSTYDGVNVATTTTANNGLVAGVVALDTLAASSEGWLQVSGYHSGVTIAVANAAGDSLVTSTTAEGATKYTIAMATGAAANQAAIATGVFGVALEATTSSTTVKALIRCM